MEMKWAGRKLKQKVLDLLKGQDFNQSLETLSELPPRRVINPLFSFLCSMEPEIRWRAVTAMGFVVANLAQENMESARVVMRRMIWNLNDESGGIGWGIPEAMGESMARHEELAREYAKILVSYVREDGNFLEYEPLQRGVLWGLGRLAQSRPELAQDAIPHLNGYLLSKDAALRGLAAWIMGMLGAGQLFPRLELLEDDDSEVKLYLNGRERVFRVKEMAQEAMTGNRASFRSTEDTRQLP